MKILITTDLFSISTNGVVTSVRNLSEELKKRGHDVRILTLSENQHSHKDGSVYFIRSIPFGIYPDVRMPTSYRHKLIKELVNWKPDVIHSQCEFFSFNFAIHISKKTDAPIIHTYHTLYEQYISYLLPFKRLGNWVVITLSNKILKGVKLIIAPTHKVEERLLYYGLSQPIQIVPSGIDLEQHNIRISDEERKKRRQSLGIEDDHFVLLNLGRIGTEKNLEELVRLYAKAVSDKENLRFLIVGDGPAKAELENLASSLGVSDKVIFAGMVDPSKVHEYYQLGDVFVSASTSETQGLTYIEAAANGLPLLCHRDPCLKDVIRQGKNGFEYTNEEDFLEKLKAITDDPSWLKEAKRCSINIANSFSKSTFGDSMEKIYESIITKTSD